MKYTSNFALRFIPILIEETEAARKKGWQLICVDGYPLGWGKRTGDVVKNHYPKGLRKERG